MTVYETLMKTRTERGGGFFLLIDPDRGDLSATLPLIESAQECGVDALLVGTSFVFETDFHQAVRKIKQASALPLILFPGASTQVAPGADAILFMSLVSGRNPQYLLEEQVRGAPLIGISSAYGLALAYMLIESASYTSVEYVSNTRPIPRTKSDLACAHALAAQYLGMKMVYLESGSGARLSVPEEMISKVSHAVDIPLIVGGDIVTPGDAEKKISSGASFVVIGTRFESPGSTAKLHEFADACHSASIVNKKQ
ncbi:MAG: geranylgeranylglyceryl/heptaprenylglyceryl phosphate synthase [Candidatus Zixiibacteriota bacterium]